MQSLYCEGNNNHIFLYVFLDIHICLNLMIFGVYVPYYLKWKTPNFQWDPNISFLVKKVSLIEKEKKKNNKISISSLVLQTIAMKLSVNNKHPCILTFPKIDFFIKLFF